MTDQNESKKSEDQRMREWSIAADKWRDTYYFLGEFQKSFALAAMKAPGFASAGGIAAALGFYSANYAQMTATPQKLEYFNSSLIFWAGALMLSVMAPGVAYLSQEMYMLAHERLTYDNDSKDFETNKNSEIYSKFGGVLKLLTLVTIIASYFCLISGGYEFWNLVQID